MRKRIAANIRKHALGGVLSVLAAIALLVVLLAAYLWTDNDRAGSLAALATVSTLALAIAAA
ncbi:MAG TPA: hypothetical protein VJ801_01705, partial [Polyangia bacterium]|nr:hypothetical protein [Polyangia bacterium]